MSNKKLFSSYLALLTLLCFTGICRARNNSSCITSLCGNINISYPFRLRGDPANCGHPDPIFALECQQNQLLLRTKSRRYHVQAITYSNFSMRASDPGLDSNNYSSCPSYSYVDDDLSSSYVYSYSSNSIYIKFLNCLSPVANPSYIKNPFCVNTSVFSNSTRVYSYVTSKSVLVSDLEESCSYDNMAQGSSPWPLTADHNYSYTQIHDILAYGFELVWYPALCAECHESKGTCSLEGNKIRCRHYCYEDTPLEERTFFCKLEYYGAYLYYAALAIGALIALRFILGVSCLIGFAVNERKRQRSSTNKTENIEELFRHQVNHMLINYSYREIKKMTQNFKTKLGRGPNGTVFRGKLRSGPLVAVEMLTGSSDRDKEFIKHASLISRITKANVVKLFGFCIKGAKRGLVYEFVQCGSLDKHVFLQEGKKPSLSVGDMFKISVGIAHGMQCLHAAQILLLGIKPHNILLDQDSNPKILDSGICSSDNHRIEAMKLHRGKMGFMAPELFYNNIGQVSCKGDVYSYGMLVLEMVAQLQALNPYGSKAGEVFFPSWIYDRLCEGQELEMRGVTEEEKEMLRKMIVAGLWCIQIRAGERPSMDQVVGMLEGATELAMPPLPFQRGLASCKSSILLHLENKP